jgi:signal peptidase II
MFWLTVVVVIGLDFVTKQLALAHLVQGYPREVIGDVLRFTLAFNTGAAFSMSIGSAAVSRVVFGVFAAIALVVLYRLHRGSRPGEWMKTLAAALAFAGAAGNLVDRIRWSRGVVDFIDVGVGDVRFWTFNIADSAVSVGAVLLAIVLWQEDRRIAREKAAAEGQPAAPDPNASSRA